MKRWDLDIDTVSNLINRIEFVKSSATYKLAGVITTREFNALNNSLALVRQTVEKAKKDLIFSKDEEQDDEEIEDIEPKQDPFEDID